MPSTPPQWEWTLKTDIVSWTAGRRRRKFSGSLSWKVEERPPMAWRGSAWGSAGGRGAMIKVDPRARWETSAGGRISPSCTRSSGPWSPGCAPRFPRLPIHLLQWTQNCQYKDEKDIIVYWMSVLSVLKPTNRASDLCFDTNRGQSFSLFSWVKMALFSYIGKNRHESDTITALKTKLAAE